MSLLESFPRLTGYRFLERMAYAERMREIWLSRGVIILDPISTIIDPNADIGPDTIIGPGTIIVGSTTIGRFARIGPYAIIVKSKLGDNVKIEPFAYVDSSELKNNVQVGPYAHIRKDSVIDEGAYVAHAEIKSSYLGKNVKVSHCAYVGDAEIGAGTNFAAGAIIANYDGQNHNKSVVGDDSFIGVNANIVAPIELARETAIAAGTTVLKYVEEPHSLVISKPKITEVIKNRVFRTATGWQGLKKRITKKNTA